MQTHHTTRAVKALKIYCPIDEEAMKLVVTGKVSSIDGDNSLSRILNIIKADNPLGDFGSYKSVVELAPGLEIFSPQPDAQPTLGEYGTATVSPTAILTVYIPADAPHADVTHTIDLILREHPWEVPVIEICDTFVVMRA